jgi:hypothetical protein
MWGRPTSAPSVFCKANQGGETGVLLRWPRIGPPNFTSAAEWPIVSDPLEAHSKARPKNKYKYKYAGFAVNCEPNKSLQAKAGKPHTRKGPQACGEKEKAELRQARSEGHQHSFCPCDCVCICVRALSPASALQASS